MSRTRWPRRFGHSDSSRRPSRRTLDSGLTRLLLVAACALALCLAAARNDMATIDRLVIFAGLVVGLEELIGLK